jgi:hypothetical protein
MKPVKHFGAISTDEEVKNAQNMLEAVRAAVGEGGARCFSFLNRKETTKKSGVEGSPWVTLPQVSRGTGLSEEEAISAVLTLVKQGWARVNPREGLIAAA